MEEIRLRVLDLTIPYNQPYRPATIKDVKQWLIQEVSKEAKSKDQIPIDIAAKYQSGYAVIANETN